MIRRVFVAVAVALAWFALAAQLLLTVDAVTAKGGGVPAAVVKYFSYFTILTNLLVAAVLTAELGPLASAPAAFLRRPGVQAAAAAYIVVVGVTYALVLRQLWHPTGLQRLVDALLHDVMPLLYVAYWLLWSPKGRLNWRQIPLWLGFPLAYLAYSLLRGALTGTYPYPFLDVTAIGYAGVLRSSAVLLAVFAGLGLLLVAVDRLLGRRAGPGEGAGVAA